MKNKIIFAVSTTMCLLTLIFIWSNSIDTGKVSSGKSGQIIDIVKPIIDPSDKISYEQFEKFIRKSAHFFEFSVLGAELSISYLYSGFIKNKNRDNFVFLMIIPAFLTAAADELIQLTSEGRACRFTDVIIDTSGATFSILIIFLLVILNKKRHDFL